MKKVIEEGDCATGAAANIAKPVKDTLTRRGAEQLARQLEDYWHGKGYLTARFWAEALDERFAKIGTYEIYHVRCNFVNGLPPRVQRQG